MHTQVNVSGIVQKKNLHTSASDLLFHVLLDSGVPYAHAPG